MLSKRQGFVGLKIIMYYVLINNFPLLIVADSNVHIDCPICINKIKLIVFLIFWSFREMWFMKGYNSSTEGLCCCEYENSQGERSNILACCCDCEAFDQAADRWGRFTVQRNPYLSWNCIFCKFGFIIWFQNKEI